MSDIASRSSSSAAAIKTVLEVDLVSYSDIARVLEENLDVEAVRKFEDQIQEFIDRGLGVVGLRREAVVVGSAGDNAILVFDEAETMHRFAESVQQQTVGYNAARSVDSAKRWFRMGAATGIVQFLPDRRIVGTTIARAVRLEAAAAKGQLVVDVETLKALPEALRQSYSGEETIHGKRDERFRGHRCTFIAMEPENDRAPVDPPIRARKTANGEEIEKIRSVYDLYRTCCLNQKYYGYKLHDLAAPGRTKPNGKAAPHSKKAYTALFSGYAEATSVLRTVVEDIRTKKGLSRRAASDYRRMRERVVELEKMDEPNPDRGLIRRFEREVNREIPLTVLWFPDAD